MSWLRTAGLILLTMIATTLPSSALTVQHRGSREKHADQTVQAPPVSGVEAESTSEKSPSKSATLKIAPNTELWDGGRTLSIGMGMAAACLTGHPGGPNLAPEERPSFPHVVEVETLRSSQHAWLSSHYPHAPPA